ncbi:MAG: LysR family transcriptional regulator [Oscillospiraceae bacterium]|nr:LysR family transcriptional regulator [Oscillospiraceae bacterium]
MRRELRAVLSVRLFTDQKCFGPGIAELLRRVDERHSLRAAAQSMEMAYSKAWKIMRNAEEGLGVKLLDSSTGGKNGGGAVLTDEARQLLSAYDSYCGKLREYADRLLAEEFAFYGDWQ